MQPRYLILTAALCVLLAASPVHAAWAVALGVTGNPVVTRAKQSTAAAELDAVAACKEQGYKSCKVVASAANGCVALATASQKWAVGAAGRRAIAKKAALEACVALGVADCKVVHDFCGR